MGIKVDIVISYYLVYNNALITIIKIIIIFIRINNYIYMVHYNALSTNYGGLILEHVSELMADTCNVSTSRKINNK